MNEDSAMNIHEDERPTVLVLAASDSSGGAGLQADLRAIHAMGVHALAVPTAVTDQEIDKVHSVVPQSADAIGRAITMLTRAHTPSVIKAGLLPTAQVVAAVHAARKDSSLARKVFIVDPVLIASSGDALSGDQEMMRELDAMLPQIDLLTPNLAEAGALLGTVLDTDNAIEQSAALLLEKGLRAILVKGGHRGEEDGFSQDYYADRGGAKLWLTSPRLPGGAAIRGTGCTLASAVAALVARGYTMVDAIVVAKSYVASAMLSRYRIAGGRRPLLDHGAHPFNAEVFPWISATAVQGRERLAFATMDKGPIGIYPIVDRASWIERLSGQGVTTIQLRVKDLTGAALEDEIKTSIAHARRCGVRLFINDFWQLAIQWGAYGVHLGQEDVAALPSGAFKSMTAAGLRLGVSTHSYEEAARAHRLRPSYMALGPIFPTTCKSMAFGPQGIAKSRNWVDALGCPIVAIGGLGLEHAPELAAIGVDGIAVITDILKASDPEGRARDWVAQLKKN